MPWLVPSKIKVDFSRVSLTPKVTPAEGKGSPTSRSGKKSIRKKFKDFASDVLEKTASKFSRHEQVGETQMFVLERRKKESSHKPPYRIIFRMKPIHCIAASHSEAEIMRMWRYCKEELPKRLPKTKKNKSLHKWVLSHFVMMAIEQTPASGNDFRERARHVGVPASSYLNIPTTSPFSFQYKQTHDHKLPHHQGRITRVMSRVMSVSKTLSRAGSQNGPAPHDQINAGIICVPVCGFYTYVLISCWVALTFIHIRQSGEIVCMMSVGLMIFALYLLLDPANHLGCMIQLEVPVELFGAMRRDGKILQGDTVPVEKRSSSRLLTRLPTGPSMGLSPVAASVMSSDGSPTRGRKLFKGQETPFGSLSTTTEVQITIDINPDSLDSSETIIDLNLIVDGFPARKPAAWVGRRDSGGAGERVLGRGERNKSSSSANTS
mmetsp:Transcript_22033/g.39070  ORF Transcript_22033/g.39070 Transcript_22033/m.39070 type:complete len:435 (-) Transcript_22033:4-1308(-)